MQDKQQPKYSLSTKILLSLLLALILGFIADPACLPFVNQWIAPLGIMFINLIKMMIVPLIFSSIIAAVTSLHEPQKLKRIGLSTIGLYLLTTLAAIAIGLFVANIIKPGIGVSLPGDAQISEKSAPALMDTLVGLIPANPVAAMANGEILPLIVFSLFLGMSILKMGGEKGKLLANFFAACAETSYTLIGIIMKFTPIGVFALLFPIIVQSGVDIVLPLISLIGSVALGCLLHGLVTYGALLKFLGKMSPLKFFRNIFEAMTVAFTTVSSAATLPINMKNCQDNLKLRPEIVSFVLPLGANINMDGTAIYIGVSTIFAANLYGVDFSWGQMLIIVLTGTLGSIGAASVPGTAVIMLATVLQSVGLPLEAIAIIAGVDRFTDMFATCLNITGDATVAAVINENENRREIMP